MSRDAPCRWRVGETTAVKCKRPQALHRPTSPRGWRRVVPTAQSTEARRARSVDHPHQRRPPGVDLDLGHTEVPEERRFRLRIEAFRGTLCTPRAAWA